MTSTSGSFLLSQLQIGACLIGQPLEPGPHGLGHGFQVGAFRSSAPCFLLYSGDRLTNKLGSHQGTCTAVEAHGTALVVVFQQMFQQQSPFLLFLQVGSQPYFPDPLQVGHGRLVAYEAIKPFFHAQDPDQPITRILLALGAGVVAALGYTAPVHTAVVVLRSQMAAQTPARRLGLELGAQPAVQTTTSRKKLLFNQHFSPPRIVTSP